MITVCCPTLNRYDYLVNMIESAKEGTVVPDEFMIVDNGGKLSLTGNNIKVHTPGYNLGVAASWNLLIKNSIDYRIIVNDDIEFNLDTVELMVEKAKAGFGMVLGCGYSCFLIQDSLVKEVGWFDEDLSPGYGYFEDNDYAVRMRLRGIVPADVPPVVHRSGMTRRMLMTKGFDCSGRYYEAESRYRLKWGGKVDHETLYH